MTAPARNQNAVARRDEKPAAAPALQKVEGAEGKSLDRMREFGALNPAAQAEFRRAQQLRGVADMIGLTEWGKNLTPAGSIAMARWCMARGVDPITDIDNVGGPYINSEFFLRKLGELRVAGVVRDHTLDNIANDPRLEALAKDQHAPDDVREKAKAEHFRRVLLRIEHGVPDQATGACLCSIYLAGGGEPITGVKWGGGGTSVKQHRRDGGTAPNPIVEANPVLSVESQAIRRAMRSLALAHPGLVDLSSADTEAREIASEHRLEGATPFDQEPRALGRGSRQGDPSWTDNDVYTGQPRETMAIEPKGDVGDAYDETPAPKVEPCPICNIAASKPEEHHIDCSRYADPDRPEMPLNDERPRRRSAIED